MSWFPEQKRTWLERVAISLVQRGRTPVHVAFIMDGNRRFAQKLHSDTITGHVKGFEKLSETLSWCRDVGITQATLYAFSIENFKRPQSEVDALMDLFREKFRKFNEEYEKFEKYQVCIRVFGKLELLPGDIQKSIAKVVVRTAQFDRFHLNICFAYTSREEIASAMCDLRDCVAQGIIEPCDINEATLSNAMYTTGLPDPDILIRTSGEIRLSDFLLWQSSFAVITFVKVLWPEFTLWNFLFCIFRYQQQIEPILEAKKRYHQFLKQKDIEYCREIFEKSQTNVQSFQEFLELRNRRIEKCRRFLQNKRLAFFAKLYNSSDEDRKSCNGSDHFNNNNINGNCLHSYSNGNST